MAKLKYTEDFPAFAEDYARQGMTDEEIFRKLGISKNTFYRYMNIHRDFNDAIKRGKGPVDFEVENVLLKRAKGYEYEETTVEYKPEPGGTENPIPTLVRKTVKQVIPDTTAQIFWLKNRRRKLWRDDRAVLLTGEEDSPIQIAFVPIEKMRERQGQKELTEAPKGTQTMLLGPGKPKKAGRTGGDGKGIGTEQDGQNP